jgi:hypothetical protein
MLAALEATKHLPYHTELDWLPSHKKTHYYQGLLVLLGHKKNNLL